MWDKPAMQKNPPKWSTSHKNVLEREACDNDLQEGKCAQQIGIISSTDLQFSGIASEVHCPTLI